MPLASCDVPVVSHDQKSLVETHFNCLDLRNLKAPPMTPLAHMKLMPVPMASHKQKSHVAPNFIHPDVRNALALFTVLSVSCDTTLMMSHKQESHIVHHFNHLMLTNKMLSLTIPSMSCDAYIYTCLPTYIYA